MNIALGGTFNQTGTVSGTGNIFGTFINSGIVNPGNSVGILTHNGDYTQTSAGVLVIEMDGQNPGFSLGYDIFNVVGGTVTLDPGAQLSVLLQGGFLPPALSVYDVLIYDMIPISGIFDFTSPVWMIGPDVYHFDISYNVPTTVEGGLYAVRLTAVTPEPETYLMLGSLLAFCLFALRRKKSVTR